VQERGWLLDGYPRSASQAEAIEKEGIRPDIFLLIDVSLLGFGWAYLVAAAAAAAAAGSWRLETAAHAAAASIACASVSTALATPTAAVPDGVVHKAQPMASTQPGHPDSTTTAYITQSDAC
jgi:hypothetical protein